MKKSSLEYQIEQAATRWQMQIAACMQHVNDLRAQVEALTQLLLEQQLINQELFAKRVQEKIWETERENPSPTIALRMDSSQELDEPLPQIDCAKRIPFCKAACCSLRFALNAQEVEQGIVKWEIGEPYYIRHEKNGYCSHCQTEEKTCQIYENRPLVCHQYTCTNDGRIWLNFEQMIPNTEWLQKHLQKSKMPIHQAIQQMINFDEQPTNVIDDKE